MLTKYQKKISLLPSATEILFELGIEDILKGVTHACTYPLGAVNKPKIIRPSIDVKILNTIEIDKKIKNLSINNQQIFILDSKN